MSFHSVSIWCHGRRRMCQVKHLKLPVLLATSTWWSLLEKMLFIWGLGFILSMFSGLTRCFRVLELIGFRLVWEVLLVKLWVLVLVLLLDRFFCLFVARMPMVTMLKRLFVVLSSSSLVVKRLLSAGNGASRSLTELTSPSWGKRSVLSLMVSTLSSSHAMDLWLTVSREVPFCQPTTEEYQNWSILLIPVKKNYNQPESFYLSLSLVLF